MHRIDRSPFRPFSRCSVVAALLAAGISAGAGCTLITDVDRSKIPAAEVVPPDPLPDVDAGETPAPEEDAGSAPDAAADAGSADDAGTPPAPAPDGGEPAASDAG